MTHWLRDALRRPFGQSVALLVAAFVVFKWGIPYLPPLLGVTSAPIPQSIMLQYMLTALVGVLIYVSADENRWREFKAPLHAALVEPDKRNVRAAALVVIPLAVGWVTFQQTRPRVPAPIQLRSIHPAPPGQITFQGKSIALTGLENPLRKQGSLQERYQVGKRLYYQNCLPCHGDLLDGNGHYAHGFSPTPLSFQDAGNIAQLTESFVFWRIAKGGPGLPREGTPWNSAMPVWESFLTEDEIWSVILFLYQQTGYQPRRWETEPAAKSGAK